MKTIKRMIATLALGGLAMGSTIAAENITHERNEENCCTLAKKELNLGADLFEEMSMDSVLGGKILSIPKYKVQVYDINDELLMEKEVADIDFIEDGFLKTVLRHADFIIESKGTAVYKINK